MAIIEDLSGQRFGNWTVLNDYIKSKGIKGRVKWKTVCDCGFEKYTFAIHLKKGQSTCCQTCAMKEFGKTRNEIPLSNTFWRRIQASAKLRNISFEVTKEEAYEIFIKQNGQCAYTNLKLVFHSEPRLSDGTASLDRIDSYKGYTKDNIQWVHKKVNIIKSNLSENNFIAICHLVAENTEKPSSFYDTLGPVR